MTARKKTAAKKTAKRGSDGSTRDLTAALAHAAWVEADAALADALWLFDALHAETKAQQRAEWLALLGLSLARAARRRGLNRIGEVGQEALYDAQAHELVVGKAAKSVEVLARGVSRGDVVLARARVKKLT